MDTKPATRYTPTEAASIIGISPNSLRNWCATFKDFLSPGATPSPGDERILNDKDVAVLQKVKEMRADHRSYDHIKNELSALPVDTELAPYIDLQPAPEPPEAATAIQPASSVNDALLGVLQAGEAKYEALQRQIDAMQAQQNGRMVTFIAGIIVGMLLVIGAAVLLWVGSAMR